MDEQRKKAAKAAFQTTRNPFTTAFGAILDQEIAHAIQAGITLETVRDEIAIRLAAIEAAIMGHKKR